MARLKETRFPFLMPSANSSLDSVFMSHKCTNFYREFFMAVQRHFPNLVQNFKLKPDYLKPQDKVAILAPAGRVFQEELEENLNFLKSLDLIPILGENLFQDFFEGYHYAGNPEQRIADFQQALDNPEIKAIWCARGGYGSVLLLDNLI